MRPISLTYIGSKTLRRYGYNVLLSLVFEGRALLGAAATFTGCLDRRKWPHLVTATTEAVRNDFQI